MDAASLPDRRQFLATCSRLGLAGLFPGVLWSLASAAGAAPVGPIPGDPVLSPPLPAAPRVTKAMIAEAARIAGVDVPEDLRDAMLAGLASSLDDYAAIRALRMPNSVSPAFVFDPLLPGRALDVRPGPTRTSSGGVLPQPSSEDDLAFASVLALSELLRARRVTSLRLTQLALARLERLDASLHCVVTSTRERALERAAKADAEIAAGRWRGPLHGIPWGAKDLLAVRGYPTTWGAGGFETQSFDEDATVVSRLDDAGAVLVAKLSLGALAMGDRWYGGMTRNPWRLDQGSSGSSAGSAAAVAAGCVPFAIGSETLGSISSPARRCGVTGLRPTFGRVPRTGAMALSWTMDKLGPIARTVEDCALVLSAIHGRDGKDQSVVRDVPFAWDAEAAWKLLRIGYVASAFAAPPPRDASAPADAGRDAARLRREQDSAAERAALDVLRGMGVDLVPVEMPDLPWGPMVQVLVCEAAAAFDDLTRDGRDRLLTGQGREDWPNIFRVARFVPAVEYVNAARARMLGMEAVAKIFDEVDVIVSPTGGLQLVVTNMTGHPAVVVPNGLRGADSPEPAEEDDGGGPGTPMSLTFLGGLYQEASLLAVAKAYQDATGHHLARPPMG